MKDLVKRLKAAEIGNRELDVEIAERRGWEVHWATDMGGDFYPYGVWGDVRKGEKGIVPFYTINIDAALTLVPEGWYWGVDCRGVAHLDPAGTFPIVMDGSPCFTELQAATPALAICIAALHALKEK